MVVTAVLGVSFAAIESTRSLLCSRVLGLLRAPGHPMPRRLTRSLSRDGG